MRIQLVCNLCDLDVRVCECFDPEEAHPDYTDYLTEEGP